MIQKLRFPVCLALSLFFHISLPAQTLPAAFETDWSKAGPNVELPAYDTIDVFSRGLQPDATIPANSILNQMMSEYAGQPTVFYFPPGSYFFNETIVLTSGHVLKGASSEETVFQFNLNGQGHLIAAKGAVEAMVSAIVAASAKDASTISVENAGGFQVGDYVRIQFDDAHLVTSSWAEKSTGQITTITAIQNNQLVIADQLRRDISLTENPYVEKIIPVEHSGVECLHLERLDATTTQTSNIFFQLTANCRVKGVSSHHANFAHVDIHNGLHNQVTGCHFKDAFAYGNGGQGYGVVLEFNTGDCLVDNNVFDHLRHAILLQAGANGNVVSYNYSINPYWNEVGLPEDSAGDLVLHGNYPYLNLLEGNIVQHIVIDDSHGSNGPGNVFLRNRAEHYGIFMNDNVPTDQQAFIGNEVTSTNFLLGYYHLAGANHFEYGNNIKGNVIPAGTTASFYPSLYLPAELPDYFGEYEVDVPAVGFPNSLNAGANPAKLRLGNDDLTLCDSAEDPVVSRLVEPGQAALRYFVHPNPANTYLYVESEWALKDYSIKLTDLKGHVVFSQNKAPAKIDISGLDNGLYILLLENGREYFYQKISVVK